MIRINRTNDSEVPGILTTRGVVETEVLKTEFDHGATEFSFNKNIYASSQVKEELIRIQHGKCCFCESEFRAVSYGDVEHYRPKGGWIQNDEGLNTPGYYWLAYEWSNLMLSCQICNQQFKRNYFPLVDNEKRALNHNYNIDDEEPIFVHPVNDNPEDYIEFDKNLPIAIGKNVRGQVTIEKLGLDRDVLNEKRLKTLDAIVLLCNLAKGMPETNAELREQFKQYIVNAHKDSREYASMLRCFFRKNPIDF